MGEWVDHQYYGGKLVLPVVHIKVVAAQTNLLTMQA